jgi:hypothetical protein
MNEFDKRGALLVGGLSIGNDISKKRYTKAIKKILQIGIPFLYLF